MAASCTAPHSQLRSRAAKDSRERESGPLPRSGTLTVGILAPPKPLPRSFFLLFVFPSFRASPAKILVPLSLVFLCLHRGWRSLSHEITSQLMKKHPAASVGRGRMYSFLSARISLLFIYLRWRRAFLGSPSSVVLTAVQRFSEFR